MHLQSDYTLRNVQAICRVVHIGTYCIIAAIAALLLVSLGYDHMHVLGRLVVCGIAFLYVAVTQWLARHTHYYAVAYLLVAFYYALATGVVWTWGVNTPIGTLIFGLVIVLAGILLSAKHAIYAALAASAVLLGVQAAADLCWHTPDTSWTGNKSGFGDVVAYCVVFGMLGLVSWLYNREMERSLLQAEQAQVALKRQKAMLKTQVKQRTNELRQVQLEEMRQMYRFAELGQLGVTLLHDLANHLTALTLEIDYLQSKNHAVTVARVRRIINYLENTVVSTRARLHGETQTQTFNIVRQTSDAIDFLRYKAAKVGVSIDWEPAGRAWNYVGDPDSFSQIVAIITNNAIDSYGAASAKKSPARVPRVGVTMERNDTHIIMRISDHGKGITKADRKQLFKPSHSSKKSGLGLGLYIAKQTVEMRFSGTITAISVAGSTQFVISLPRTDKGL